jgi:hypothetical protein
LRIGLFCIPAKPPGIPGKNFSIDIFDGGAIFLKIVTRQATLRWPAAGHNSESRACWVFMVPGSGEPQFQGAVGMALEPIPQIYSPLHPPLALVPEDDERVNPTTNFHRAAGTPWLGIANIFKNGDLPC